MKNTKPTKEQYDAWNKDDKNWRFFKSIYFNKDDDRIFLPKRIEWMGWTLNFAHPKAYAILFSIPVLMIIIIMFAEKGFR